MIAETEKLTARDLAIKALEGLKKREAEIRNKLVTVRINDKTIVHTFKGNTAYYEKELRKSKIRVNKE